MSIRATFLGVGAAHATELGNSSLAIEVDGKPWLLIDCGFDTLHRYQARYPDSIPTAVFITHCHFDHIGGLEQLYFQARFSNVRPIIYVPHLLISTLVSVLGNTLLAEGRENVWDILNIVPVQNTFYHQNVKLNTYPVRHHAPNSAFSLHMPGCFFYSGDTRPIPEILHHHINNNEIIFHDCSLVSNPSHTGLEDLIREYSSDVLHRLIAYHYSHENDRKTFAKHDIKSAQVNSSYTLPTVNSENVSYALSQSA